MIKKIFRNMFKNPIVHMLFLSTILYYFFLKSVEKLDVDIFIYGFIIAYIIFFIIDLIVSYFEVKIQ